MISKIQNLNNWRDLAWGTLRQKSFHNLPRWVFILALVLLLQSLTKLTWKIVSDEPEIQTSRTSLNKTEIPAKPSSSLKDVAALHLFGDAKKTAPVQQAIIDAPDTRLRLDLKGVFATNEPAKALAIISSSKQQDKTYRIGDKIIGGAELHAVYSDRVILKRNGRLETLRLPESKLDNTAIEHSVIPSQNSSVQPNATEKPAVQTSQSQLNQISQEQKLRKMRDTLVKEPAKIWEQVRINPVMKNGKVQGYTLTHDDQALMTAMNLRKTDVITAINGQSLGDPSTLYGLMLTLTEQQSIELTVNRNGQEQTIMLSF